MQYSLGSIETRNKFGWRLFRKALLEQNFDILKSILHKAESEPVLQDIWEKTPLHRAVEIGDMELVDFLISTCIHRINYGRLDAYGRTPLFYAHTAEMIDLLVSRFNFGINFTDYRGQTPLCYVASRPTWNIGCHIAAGANVDFRDAVGRTPLSYSAVAAESTEGIELLLAARANPSIPDREGHTPLWWAFRTGNPRGAIVLLEKTQVIPGSKFLATVALDTIIWPFKERTLVYNLVKGKFAKIPRSTQHIVISRRNSTQLDDPKGQRKWDWRLRMSGRKILRSRKEKIDEALMGLSQFDIVDIGTINGDAFELVRNVKYPIVRKVRSLSSLQLQTLA
ncbi:ankyrin [Lophiostoma macrostomum CBS 122681]|uniref:Ankyrin n=1 Tax=Lophiostoma macrostomum CBS 122681 TaxID=1314788 RepID=A0A6A6SJW6_9PLEO|nr:ankyrin [Lophiostoma macrostomum CBS 122681]